MNEGGSLNVGEDGVYFKLTAKVKVAQVRKTLYTPIFKIKALGLEKVEDNNGT